MHYITVQYNNLRKYFPPNSHFSEDMKICCHIFGLWNCQMSPVHYTYGMNKFIDERTEVSDSRETVGQEVIVLLLRPETPDEQR